MKTFMFPGQGSQFRGMGGKLFGEFRELSQEADDILGYSVKTLCLEDPRRELNKTQFTQPALYVVNALYYLRRIAEHGDKPQYVVGHSLGEFNALFAAECFGFATGLKLVSMRGQVMSQAPSGAMAAIVNASKVRVETLLREHGLVLLDLANHNTPSQIVISGPREDITAAQTLFQTGPIQYHPLNTSGAFHSRLMRPAGNDFEHYLRTFQLSRLKIPVVANTTARPYEDDDIADGLSRQISSMVRWSESIQYLMALPGAHPDGMQFEELGPGNVLSRLLQTIKHQTTPADLRRVQETLGVRDDRMSNAFCA